MFAADRGWVTRIADAIRSGLTAEAAVQKVSDDTRTRMMQVSDAYLRERLFDLDDLANRLLRHLSGRPPSAAWAELPPEFILVARAMGPAELLDYARRRIMGLVLEEGSPTAHVAIVARAFDIPVVGQVNHATSRIETGDILVVDGDHARVFIRPSADVQQSMATAAEARTRRRAFYETLRASPPITRDGIEIKLLLNAGLLFDLSELSATGAEGVGLFRTEFPLMVRNTFPTVEELTEFYRRVFEQAEDRPVVFRTLDIGGDKVLPYLPHAIEDNPAMGWRAIRIGLDRPAMLRLQLRALIRAAEARTLFVKFPMVAEVAELEQARALVNMELGRATDERRALPESIKIGVMLEVPALLWQLPALCERIDFLSIGTNDLLQFLFACDRGNPRLAERYDPLSAPMLRLFRDVIQSTRAARVPLSMCGDMAGNPLEAMALIALGFRTLSMAATSIGPVKTMIRSLNAKAVADYLDEIGGRPDHSLRPKLEAYARDHDIAL
jgi:phosphotransferase system enzyme I (PtsP)